MSMRYYQMPLQYSLALDIMNYIFTAIFNLECIFKIIAQSKKYFYQSWNIFDFIVVLSTDIGIVLNFVNSGVDISTGTTVVRAFRIMRAFRIIKTA